MAGLRLASDSASATVVSLTPTFLPYQFRLTLTLPVAFPFSDCSLLLPEPPSSFA